LKIRWKHENLIKIW